MIQYSKCVEQPEEDYHHHHDIEDLLDFPIHGNVGVDEPKEDSDDDESDYDTY